MIFTKSSTRTRVLLLVKIIARVFPASCRGSGPPSCGRPGRWLGMKASRYLDEPLAGKTLAMIFTKSSTRVRVLLLVKIIARVFPARGLVEGSGPPSCRRPAP